jgi:hypothetical protein
LFNRCSADTLPVPSIEADIAAATKIGGQGTPTIVIGAFRFRQPPDSAMLDSAVKVVLRRRSELKAR